MTLTTLSANLNKSSKRPARLLGHHVQRDDYGAAHDESSHCDVENKHNPELCVSKYLQSPTQGGV